MFYFEHENIRKLKERLQKCANIKLYALFWYIEEESFSDGTGRDEL